MANVGDGGITGSMTIFCETMKLVSSVEIKSESQLTLISLFGVVTRVGAEWVALNFFKTGW